MAVPLFFAELIMIDIHLAVNLDLFRQLATPVRMLHCSRPGNRAGVGRRDTPDRKKGEGGRTGYHGTAVVLLDKDPPDTRSFN
jgi:hypothetical protein